MVQYEIIVSNYVVIQHMKKIAEIGLKLCVTYQFVANITLRGAVTRVRLPGIRSCGAPTVNKQGCFGIEYSAG